MPEFVNIGADGCVGIRLPDRTGVCPRSTKKSIHRRRSSLAVSGRNRAEDMGT